MTQIKIMINKNLLKKIIKIIKIIKMYQKEKRNQLKKLIKKNNLMII
jgi:hypothetical protein